MPSQGEFQVDPAAVAQVLNGLADLLGQLDAAVTQFRDLPVPTAEYGMVGAEVAAANTALRAQSAAALAALAATMSEAASRIQLSLDGYRQTDTDIARDWSQVTTRPPRR